MSTLPTTLDWAGGVPGGWGSGRGEGVVGASEWLSEIFMGQRALLTGCQPQDLGNPGKEDAKGTGQSQRGSISAVEVPDPNPAPAGFQMAIRLKRPSKPHSLILV